MPIFMKNFNYFLALFIAGSMLSLWFIAPWIGIIFTLLGGGLYSHTVGQFLAMGFVLAALVRIWATRGKLLPYELKPKARRRYQIGVIAITIANLIVVTAVVIAIGGAFFVKGFGVAVGVVIALPLSFSVPIGIAGIICIETSKLRNVESSKSISV